MTRRQQRAHIEFRRAKVAEMHLKGQVQIEIAVELGVSRSTISRDMRAMLKEWRAARIGRIAQWMDCELAKLNLIEREAWLAWQRSQDDQVVSKAVKTGEGEKATQRAERSTKTQCGDPRFLTIIKSCLERRWSLLGLDTLSAGEGGDQPIDVREVLDLLQHDVQYEEFCRQQAMQAQDEHRQLGWNSGNPITDD